MLPYMYDSLHPHIFKSFVTRLYTPKINSLLRFYPSAVCDMTGCFTPDSDTPPLTTVPITLKF